MRSETRDRRRVSRSVGRPPRPARFRALGPLEVSGEGGALPLGGPKQRTALAHLILNANQVVAAERLIDALWGEEPPDAARGTLQAYISRLRSVLGSSAIEGRAPGYLLRVEPDEIDVLRFERLLRDARRDAFEPKQASKTLTEALDLWRGPALADLAAEPSLSGEIARLEELRIQATEERLGAELDLGRHAQAVAELEILTRAHPLRERLWGELMLALYRVDRQADALAAFDRARAILSDDLGIDPSRELRDLQERILRQDPSLDLVGEPLRGYRVLEQIGEGAFGVVYRAIQPQVEREVAIKAVHPELANHPDFVRRFEREAQIVARLEHPHIVPLYDYWREPDGAYLVMRFLRGGSVEDLLASGPLEPARVAAIVDQVASALAAAHREGIVHRDVKPGNVLLDEEGNAYLTDFGVALDAGSPEKSTGTMMRGTPAYLSPEQIRLDPATPQSDVYALGIVAYEMLTGTHPFPGSSLTALLDRHLRDPVPPLRDARPDLTSAPAVDRVIARATAKDVPGRFEDVLQLAAALRAALEGSSAPTTSVAEVRNPYKGLRAFLEADGGDFFGREAPTNRLIRRLQEQGEGSRFLAVVGPSGSGKSSLVRAGLLPALRQEAIAGSDHWYVIDVLPGSHPMREIETALLGIAVDPPPSLLEELERDPVGLLRAAHAVLPDPTSELLIVVDQLEEVFTLVDDEEERAHVLASLRAAALEPDSRVRVVATLRADFYDEPLMVRGFGDLLAARTEAITPMSLEELERAIVAPADRSGLKVEPTLLAAILADVGERPSALPLLQFALTEVAEHHDGGVLRLGIYRQIGGASGALARRAERIFEGLSDPGREACRQLFLRLVTLGEGTEDTRRRVRRSELLPLADALAVDGVIETFGRHRLLSFDRDSESREPTVEIAHEALLAAWDRLNGWIDEARDDIRTQRQLSNAASEWATARKDGSFLLRGVRLEQAASWVETTNVALASHEKEYVRASVAERDTEQAAEEARRNRVVALERRSVRRSRALVAVFAVAALVATSLTVIASRQSDRAERETRIAQARELAAASIASLDDDVDQSLLLAIEAVNTTYGDNGTVLPEAEQSLHRAIQADRLVRTFPAFNSVDFSPDGSRLLTAGAEPGTALVYDLENGEESLTIRHGNGDLAQVAYSPDGTAIATASYPDKTTKVWDSQTGEQLMTFGDPSGKSICCSAEFSPDGSVIETWIYSANGDCCTTRFYSLKTGKELRRLRIGWSGRSSFSPDGEHLGLGDCVVEWRKPEAGQHGICAPRHPGFYPTDISWSSDGSLVATSFSDGSITIWDPGSGDQITTLAPGDGVSYAIDFSPNGTRLAAGFTDGTVRLWDLVGASATEVFDLPGQSEGVTDLTFSSDGTRLASASTNEVKVWDVTPRGGDEWLSVTGSGGFAFSPDGQRFAIGHGDNTVHLYDADTGETSRIFTARGRVLGVTFDRSGDRLAVGTTGGSISVWDVETGDQPLKLEGHEGGNVLDVAFSPDGRLLGSTSDSPQIGSTELWDASSGATVRAFEGGGQTLAFSPDGARLAVTSSGRADRQEQRILIWDVGSGAEVRTLNNHLRVNSLAFSPDGKQIVAGGFDGALRVWDVETGRSLGTMEGNLSQIWDIAFSSDGKLLATASDDGTVRLWDPIGRRQLLTVAIEDLGGDFHEGFDVGFSPDGTRLAATAGDGRLHVFVLPVEELLHIARARVGRGFTQQECRQYLHLDTCPAA
jgi:WD40 repeat protein/serine/threonine protein kinase